MQYDCDNAFYKIIHGTIKANVILEGEHFVAFHDIAPKAPVHVLVIPKGNYADYYDFMENAANEEIIGFFKGVNQIVKLMKLEQNGFKLRTNSGKFRLNDEGGQEVMHMHFHVLGKSTEE
ncbi:MAG: HIT domain-containing protein [Holosporales bacterium]|jgi:diadenosine tetraphosphate (Ap4A) HIT family hydrolase|nr:HIT domain-containing protein [Holosporales bacterium]